MLHVAWIQDICGTFASAADITLQGSRGVGKSAQDGVSEEGAVESMERATEREMETEMEMEIERGTLLRQHDEAT